MAFVYWYIRDFFLFIGHIIVFIIAFIGAMIDMLVKAVQFLTAVIGSFPTILIAATIALVYISALRYKPLYFVLALFKRCRVVSYSGDYQSIPIGEMCVNLGFVERLNVVVIIGVIFLELVQPKHIDKLCFTQNDAVFLFFQGEFHHYKCVIGI